MESKFNPITKEDEARVLAFDDLEQDERQAELDRMHVRALVGNNQTIYDKVGAEFEKEVKEDLCLAIDVIEAVNEAGGYALIVGGYARDMVLNNFGYQIKPKDI